MKFFLAAFLVLLTQMAFAADRSVLEMRLVAESPSATTKEFTLTSSKGTPEKVLLESTVLLDGSALEWAQVTHDESGLGIVIRLTESGKKQFAKITTDNVNRRLGLVVNGKLMTAPVIREPIPDGRVAITGNFSEAEVKELITKLNAKETR